MRFKLKIICPVLFLFVVTSVLVLPGQASGQSVDNRYCPNPSTDFFKGSIYYENGKPWIETIVDPDFEQKVLRVERKISGDIPLTPVYNLVVRIKPEFNYYCIPGWAENAFSVTADKLPHTVPIDGYIGIGTEFEIVTEPGVFNRTERKDEQGRFIYEWKIKGWYSGIAKTDTLLKKLARAISKGEPVDVSIVIAKDTVDGRDYSSEKEPLSFSLCAPIWGSGEHKIISMTRVSDNEWFSPVFRLEGARLKFAETQPYQKYQSHFSYFADLSRPLEGNEKARQVSSSLLAVVMNVDFLGSNTISMHNSAFARILSDSPCGNNGVHLVFVDGLLANAGISTLGRVPLVGAMIDVTSANDSLRPESPSLVAVHEYSHAGPGLNDEYVYKTKHFFEIPLRNCSSEPTVDYFYGGKFYGATKYDGCSFPQYNRPSNNSLMNIEEKMGPVFNSVSCGHIIAFILGGDAKSYFSECSKMGGIEVRTQNVFTPVFAWFKNQVFSPSSLTAQVGSSGATVNKGQGSPYLIVESFDPDNQWGEIVQVTSDSTAAESIDPGTVIKDPRDEIFADFEPASFPIFDPELFDELAQELAASGDADPTLWQKFLNLFSSDDATTPLSGDETYPPAPLVSAPSIQDANRTIVMSGGNVESGTLTLTGIISVPKDEWFSEVKNTFQYASGQGTFVDWVSFTFPEGLKPRDTATDTYTWQAGEGDWRFRLCMDSKEKGRTCGEETSVTIVGSVSRSPIVTPSCAGPSKLVPTTPILSGENAGAGKLRSGMMKVSTSITNTTGSASQVTSGRFEYSQDGKKFTPWVNFSVPTLSPCAKSSTSYSWEGGEGTWFMRACIKDECSESAEMEVVP